MTSHQTGKSFLFLKLRYSVSVIFGGAAGRTWRKEQDHFISRRVHSVGTFRRKHFYLLRIFSFFIAFLAFYFQLHIVRRPCCVHALASL